MPFVADPVQEAPAAPPAAPSARKPRFVPDAVQDPSTATLTSQPAVTRGTPEAPGFLSGLRDKASEFIGDQVDSFRDRYNNAEVATSQYLGDYADEIAAARAKRIAATPAPDDPRYPDFSDARNLGQLQAGASLALQVPSIIASNMLLQRPSEAGLDPAAEYQQFRERTSYTPADAYPRALGEEFGAYFKPVGDAFHAAGEGLGSLFDAVGAKPEFGQQIRAITPDLLGVAGAPKKGPLLELPEAVKAPPALEPPVQNFTMVPEAAPPPPPPGARAPLEGAERARAAGYVVTPTSAGGGRIAQNVEGLTGSAKLSRDAVVKNQANTNRLAALDIGLPETTKRFTDPILDKAAAPHAAVYKELGDTVGTFQASPEYLTDLQAALPDRGLTAEAEANVRKLIAEYSTEAIDGKRAVQDTRQLRYEASKSLRSVEPDTQAIGRAKRAVSDAIEGELERRATEVGDPTLVDRFRDARRMLAKINTLKSARVGTDIGAKNLASMAKRGVPLDGRLKLIADVHGDFPNEMRSATKITDKTPVNMTDAAIAFVGERLTGGMSGLAAAAARPLARRVLMSDMYQNAYGKPVAEPLGPNSGLGEYFGPRGQRSPSRAAAAPPGGAAPPAAPDLAEILRTPPPAETVPAAAPAAPPPAPTSLGGPLGEALSPTPTPPRAPELGDQLGRREPVTQSADSGNSGPPPAGRDYTGSSAAPAGRSLADELTDYGRVIDNELLANATRVKGGVTFHTTTGHEPTPFKPGAYSVSPYPEREVILAPGEVTADSVKKFIDDNLDLLERGDHYFGTWHDKKKGKVFLDVSIVEKTVEAAIATGRKHRQIAYFSFEDMQSHDISPELRDERVPDNANQETDRRNPPRADNPADGAGQGSVEARKPSEDIRATEGPQSDTGGNSGVSSTGQAEGQGRLGEDLARGGTEDITTADGKMQLRRAGPGDSYLQVRNVEVAAGKRGQGQGLALYEAAIKRADELGLTFASDNKVSKDAQRVYAALAKRGYEVTKDPAAYTDKSGALISDNALKPVFTIKPKAELGEELSTKPTKATMDIDRTVAPKKLIELHAPRDSKKLAKLADSMREDGWKGRPVLAWDSGDGIYALTGSHRLAAAKQANVDVPLVLVDGDLFSAQLEKEGLAYDELIGIGDDRVERFLREAGDTRAADMMKDEILARDDGDSLGDDLVPGKRK